MSAHLRGRTSKLVVSISGACTAVLAQADAHKPHQSQQPFGLRGTALGTAILCDARWVHESLFANARSDDAVAELPAAGQEVVTPN